MVWITISTGEERIVFVLSGREYLEFKGNTINTFQSYDNWLCYLSLLKKHARRRNIVFFAIKENEKNISRSRGNCNVFHKQIFLIKSKSPVACDDNDGQSNEGYEAESGFKGCYSLYKGGLSGHSSCQES